MSERFSVDNESYLTNVRISPHVVLIMTMCVINIYSSVIVILKRCYLADNSIILVVSIHIIEIYQEEINFLFLFKKTSSGFGVLNGKKIFLYYTQVQYKPVHVCGKCTYMCSTIHGWGYRCTQQLKNTGMKI